MIAMDSELIRYPPNARPERGAQPRRDALRSLNSDNGCAAIPPPKAHPCRLLLWRASTNPLAAYRNQRVRPRKVMALSYGRRL